MVRNTQETIEYIQTIEELIEEEKNNYIDMIKNGADLVEVLDQIEDTLQKKLDDVFEEAGVALDENDPEYQAKHKEMINELQSAENEFNTTMEEIETEVDNFQEETVKQVDEAKKEAVRSSISSGE